MKMKLGNLYAGDWPHDVSMGVGIELIGVPNDIEKFYDVMASFSCNKVAAARVLSDLLLHGTRKVTVMAYLNFVNLFYELENIGVDMKIIEPATHSNPKYFEKSGDWDVEIAKVLTEECSLEDILINKTPLKRQILVERVEAARLAEALVGIKESPDMYNFLYPT